MADAAPDAEAAAARATPDAGASPADGLTPSAEGAQGGASPANTTPAGPSAADAVPSDQQAQDAEQEEQQALLALHPGLQVTLDLADILEHCKCSICMGIVKNTRAVSSCMHRFCKDCIEAWLRTQIENNCPQCRVKFSSKRDCKPDPNFDLLLGAMFGDIQDFEKRMLDPSSEVLERAKAVGHQIARAKDHAARRPSPPGLVLPQPAAAQPAQLEQPQQQQRQQVALAAGPSQAQAGDAVVHVTVAPARGRGTGGSKRGVPGAASEGKRLKLSIVDEDDPSSMQYRGVRFQGDNWQARTKRNGKELSLGLYNTAEEAGMAYDLDRLQQQGGKAQRLNFPLLRQHYKTILSDLADLHTPDGLLDFLAVAVQAAVKSARVVPGATLPQNTGPAAASTLNPRRPDPLNEDGTPGASDAEAAGDVPAAPAGGSRREYDREGSAIGGTSAAKAAPVQTSAQPGPDVTPTERQAVAAQRAEQLAAERSLEAGLAGGVAHVRLQTGSGLVWRMAYLACPAAATVAEVSEAVSLGLSQQFGLAPGTLSVGLAVANDLDASADFDALCYEDAQSGTLLLRGHVTVRELLRTLEDSLEDLALEYHASGGTAAADGRPAHGAAAQQAVVASA